MRYSHKSHASQSQKPCLTVTKAMRHSHKSHASQSQKPCLTVTKAMRHSHKSHSSQSQKPCVTVTKSMPHSHKSHASQSQNTADEHTPLRVMLDCVNFSQFVNGSLIVLYCWLTEQTDGSNWACQPATIGDGRVRVSSAVDGKQSSQS